MNFQKISSFIFLAFTLSAHAVESNRIWVELDEAGPSVIASRNIELFVLRAGYGDHIISGFDKYDSSKKRDTYDKILLDYESYSDIIQFGVFDDGQVVQTFTGLQIRFEQLDANGDGKPDTKISVKEDSLIILNCKPNEIQGWQLMGG